MSTEEWRKSLRELFDVNSRYTAARDESRQDLEYQDVVDFYDGRRWHDVTSSDLTAGFPAFSLLPDDAVIFFFPTVLYGLIAETEESCGPLGLLFRRMETILKTELAEDYTTPSNSLLSDAQRQLALNILESTLDDMDWNDTGARRPIQALIRTLRSTGR